MRMEMTIAKKEKGQILMIGAPRQYRADCKAGQFKHGATKSVGKKLTIEIMAVNHVDRKLFHFEQQPWVEVIFVDTDSLVSTVMFKGESLQNFMDLYRDSVVSGKNLMEIKVDCRMSVRAGKKGVTYYAVEFEEGDKGDYSEQIPSYIEGLTKKFGDDIFQTNSLPEGDGAGYINETEQA